MGQSLTVRVFYGAIFPDRDDDPRPRLSPATVAEIEAAGGNIWGDPGDLSSLDKHPAFAGLLDEPRSGVGDWSMSHLAIKATVRTEWHGGIMPLPDNGEDPTWKPLLLAALACLEWHDGDEPVPAPPVAIGWHIAAVYW